MNKDILENLNYFSEITQRTLSAFHTFDNTGDLQNEVESLKRFVSNIKVKKLVKAKKLDNDKYQRFFIDGSTDIVEDILEPAFYTNDFDFSLIEYALAQSLNPINSIKLQNDIENVRDKKIEKASEIIFFM